MVFSLARAAGHGSDAPNGDLRMRVVSAEYRLHAMEEGFTERMNHSGGRKKGSHSSGWRTRSRPRRWRNLRSGNSRTGSHTKKTAKPIAWQGSAKLRAKANYFIGSNRGRWRTNVPLYAAAGAKDIEPGVDMVVYGHNGGFEYDLRVQPHTDPSELRLELSAARECNSPLMAI